MIVRNFDDPFLCEDMEEGKRRIVETRVDNLRSRSRWRVGEGRPRLSKVVMYRETRVYRHFIVVTRRALNMQMKRHEEATTILFVHPSSNRDL